MAVRGLRNMAIIALAPMACLMGAASPAKAQTTSSLDEAVSEPASEAVAEMVAWVSSSHDNGGLPFIVVDKAAAEVFVFGPDAQALGRAPALLGSALGDDSAPGVGDRELSSIQPQERTTPAGRFVAGFGAEGGKRKVFWVDFATAISLHPVIVADPKERRRERLNSPTPEDNRITYGCINVPPAFYRDIIRTTFAAKRGVVYVLPETRSMDEVFPTFRVQADPPPTGVAVGASALVQ